MSDDRIRNGILGDITPEKPDRVDSWKRSTHERDLEDDESMSDGSPHDRTEHSGSRDVSKGSGTGTEVGGTRNYRQGSGAAGMDVGNRPE